MNRNVLCIVLALALSILFSGSIMLSVAANPTLSVSPPLKTVAVGEAFTVNVTLDYLVDMYAFDLTVTFDSVKLNATALDYTGYLGTGGDIFQISVVNNTEGFVNLAVSRLVRSGVTGGGALIVVHFKSLASGSSVLHLTDTKIAVYPTGAPVAHGTVDGQVNIGTPPTNHDIAVTNINPYRTILGNRTMTSINVTVTNEGDAAETFYVTLTFTITVTTVTLTSHDSRTLTLRCNTTGLQLGNCTFTASASAVSGETDTSDNSLPCTVQVSILGDVNGDGRVDMKDVAKVAAAFQASPNQPRWTPNGDLDENGVIDMKDISTTAKHFGEKS